jgi:hypothetical protein
MPHDLLRNSDGRFWRGNLHCHSNRSDGQREPERVAVAYQEAGYDFIALSDHFEERYGWRITDTRALRTRDFSTLIAAELSSGPWEEPRTYWVSVGPADGAGPSARRGSGRSHSARARWRRLRRAAPSRPQPPAGASHRPPARLDAVDAVDAVEIYNHSTFGSAPTARTARTWSTDCWTAVATSGSRPATTPTSPFPPTALGAGSRSGPRSSTPPRCW